MLKDSKSKKGALFQTFAQNSFFKKMSTHYYLIFQTKIETKRHTATVVSVP